MQKEAEERFRAWEEERWRKETELEDERRREGRAHKLQVLQLLTRNQLQTTQPRQQSMYSFGLHPDPPPTSLVTVHHILHYIMSISTSNIIILCYIILYTCLTILSSLVLCTYEMSSLIVSQSSTDTFPTQ